MAKKNLETLKSERDVFNKATRTYHKSILTYPLSTVTDLCFQDAERGSHKPETLKNFRRYLNELGKKYKIISFDLPLNRLTDDQLVTERIMQNSSLSSMQKKLRMHALIFLFNFLNKESGGAIPKLTMPSELAKLPPVLYKQKKAANYEEIECIFEITRSIKTRDYLVLKTIYETQKPLHMVLSLKREDIDFNTRLIQGVNQIISEELITLLQDYIKSTHQFRSDCDTLFISNQGKPIHRTQIQKTLITANQSANLPYRITTKMIQRSKDVEN